jgi:hypothetical protein
MRTARSNNSGVFNDLRIGEEWAKIGKAKGTRGQIVKGAGRGVQGRTIVASPLRDSPTREELNGGCLIMPKASAACYTELSGISWSEYRDQVHDSSFQLPELQRTLSGRQNRSGVGGH